MISGVAYTFSNPSLTQKKVMLGADVLIGAALIAIAFLANKLGISSNLAKGLFSVGMAYSVANLFVALHVKSEHRRVNG